MKKEGFDTTEGHVAEKLIMLVLPMLFANLLNVLYNIVDSIWIGQILGAPGLAAIAVSFPVIMVIISFAIGVTVACNILIGQMFGAKEYDKLMYASRAMSTISLIIAISLSIIGYIISAPLLKLLNAPQSVYEMALSYYRISMIGFPFIFYYFLTASLLRGIGDTIRPLIFLGIASVINMALDPLMIKGFWIVPAMGLDGAAYATVFSQFVSVVISVSYLKVKDSVVRVNPFRFVFDWNIIKSIFKIGIPFTSGQLVVSFAWMFVTGLINSFGEVAAASLAIVNRIDSVLILPLIALSSGIATMSAQNIGAGKMERIKEIHKVGVIFGLVVSVVISVVFIIFPEILSRMFTKDANVIEYTKSYIYVAMPAIIFLSVMFATNGIINGSGKTFVLMIFSFVSLVVIRTPLAYFLSGYFNIWGVWIASVISCFISMILSLSYYGSGKWKKNSRIV